MPPVQARARMRALHIARCSRGGLTDARMQRLSHCLPHSSIDPLAKLFHVLGVRATDRPQSAYSDSIGHDLSWPKPNEGGQWLIV